MRFGDPRVVSLLAALLIFRLLPRGFSNQDLREHMAPLMAVRPDQFSPGRMTYDLRRLRLHGFIERIPKSHRYQLTDFGRKAAVFLSRAYTRLVQPGLVSALGSSLAHPALTNAVAALDRAIERIWEEAA